MPEYQSLTDDEFLRIAADRDQLTEEALVALDAELSRRRLSSSDIDAYKQLRRDAENADDLERAKPRYFPHAGFGKKFLGKTNRNRDSTGLFEQYVSTLWFVALWFPVFPIATYTVRRDLEKWMGMNFASAPVPLERHERNWEQILLTWVQAMLIVFALIVFVPRVPPSACQALTIRFTLPIGLQLMVPKHSSRPL